MSSHSPQHNYRANDRVEGECDRLARRFLKAMILLIVSGMLSTGLRFLEINTLAYAFAGLAIVSFVYLIVTMIRLDNAIRADSQESELTQVKMTICEIEAGVGTDIECIRDEVDRDIVKIGAER
jgi:hypothetical protein